MALKHEPSRLKKSLDEPCSPLPRGNGAETESQAIPIFIHHQLAVPYLGAMALKPTTKRLPHMRQAPCSPLPRGNSAETDALHAAIAGESDLQSPTSGQ